MMKAGRRRAALLSLFALMVHVVVMSGGTGVAHAAPAVARASTKPVATKPTKQSKPTKAKKPKRPAAPKVATPKLMPARPELPLPVLPTIAPSAKPASSKLVAPHVGPSAREKSSSVNARGVEQGVHPAVSLGPGQTNVFFQVVNGITQMVVSANASDNKISVTTGTVLVNAVMQNAAIVTDASGWPVVYPDGTICNNTSNNGVVCPLTAMQQIVVYGNDGNDTISVVNVPGYYPPQIYGGNGADTLYSAGAGALVDGGPDNDTIYGTGSAEALRGGDGDDYIAPNGGADDVIGGTGNDQVDYSSAGGVNVSLDDNANDTGGANIHSDVEQIDGSGGPDVMYGGSVPGETYSLIGGAGNDTFYPGASPALIYGGDGIDTVDYSTNRAGIGIVATLGGAGPDGDVIDAGIENLIGSSGNDVLSGNSARNVIVGVEGSDRLWGGGGGADQLYGDEAPGARAVSSYGNDTLVADGDGEQLFGGGGNTDQDVVSYERFATGATLHVPAPGQVATGIGGDVVNGDIEGLWGTMGDDVIYGTNNNDNINGLGGNDTIFGYGGADVLVGDQQGGAGNDVIDPGGDDFAIDTVDGVGGSNVISYQTSTRGVYAALDHSGGSDILNNVSTLIGSAWDDTLIGTAANETLAGMGGNDVLVGNGGADVYAGDALPIGLGFPNIPNMVGNYGGNDIADFAGTQHAVVVTLGGLGPDGSTMQSDIEGLVGTAFDDTLTGNSADNYIYGNGGNDHIYGGYGNDHLFGDVGGPLPVTLVGTPGNDDLHGGPGNDELVGGSGDDFLYGDADNDVMYEEPGNDYYDGGSGDDTIDYSQADGPITVTTGDGLANDGVNFEETDNIAPSNGLDTIIGSQNDDWMTGDAGRNKFVGLGGDDHFTGMGGADVFEGDAGTDEVRFDWTTPTQNVFARIDGYADSGLCTGGWAATTIVSCNGAVEGATIGTDIENLVGGFGSDVLIGDAEDNTLVGGYGNDYLYGYGGEDKLYGFFDDDWTDTFSGPDRADYNKGLNYPVVTDSDSLFGGDGEDTLSGGPDNDFLFGEKGNDTLIGGLGQDLLNGGFLNNPDGDFGTDTIDARDGYWIPPSYYVPNAYPDTVLCGVDPQFHDKVDADPADDVQRCIDGPNRWFGDTSNGGRVPSNTWAETDIGRLTGLSIPNGGSLLDVVRDSVASNVLHVEHNLEMDQQFKQFAEKLGENNREDLAGLKEFLELAGGEENAQIAVRNDGKVQVTDMNFPIDPSPGCVQGASRHSVICTATVVDVEGTPGDDTISVTGAVKGTIDGAGGNNTLYYSAAGGTQASFSLDGLPNDGPKTNGVNGTLNITNLNKIVGGDEDDIFQGTAASETFDGGGGFNTMSYADHTATEGVTVTLPEAGQTTDDGMPNEHDKLTNIEAVWGGAGNDTLTGSSVYNVIRGGPGADVMNGGGGIDLLDYSDKSVPVAVTLPAAGATATGQGDGDTISNFENLAGGSANDILIGNEQANSIWGGGGNDNVKGGAGDDQLFGEGGNDTLDGQAGADLMDGGAGSDLIDYSQRTNGVTVTLDGQANDGEPGENDNVITANGDNDIVRGGSGNDTFMGSAWADRFQGGPGDDSFWGGGGGDDFAGGTGWDTAHYDNVSASTNLNVSLDGVANDAGPGEGDNVGSDNSVEEVDGGPGNDTLTGNDQANKLVGNAGNDFLRGGLGADTLIGGANVDTLAYDEPQRTSGVTVTLPEGGILSAGQGAAGENDSIQGFENLTGSKFNDKLTGNSGNNNILDGAGNDTVNGAGGNDSFVEQPGADEYIGGGGSDTISYATVTSSVNVSLDNVANDGILSPAEKDNVHDDVHVVVGATGATYITGSPGDDILLAAPNNTAGTGMSGGSGKDLLFGGPGPDALTGDGGVDTFYGNGGDDYIKAHDGNSESISCGMGYDKVELDYSSGGAKDTMSNDCDEFYLPGWTSFVENPNVMNVGSDAASSKPGRIDTVITDNATVTYRFYDCIGLKCGWNTKNIGGKPTTAPSITASAGAVYVVVGTTGNHVEYSCSTCSAFGLGTWTDISSDGTRTLTTSTDPEIAAFNSSASGDGSFAVITRDANKQMYYRMFCTCLSGQSNLAHWSKWIAVSAPAGGNTPGGGYAGGVGAAASNPGTIDVATVGADGHLYHATLKSYGIGGVVFGAWEDLGIPSVAGAKYVGNPDVASSGPGNVDITALSNEGTGSDMWWKPFRDGRWLPGRQLLSQQLVDDVAVTSQGTNQLYAMTGHGKNMNLDEAYFKEPPPIPGS